jgi:hypothetical protein
MRLLSSVMALLLNLVLMQALALADLPAPKAAESPNVDAGRKAIDAKDYKTAVGYLTRELSINPWSITRERSN